MGAAFLGLSPVLENSRLEAGVFLLRLESPAIAAAASPGQFVMVRAGGAPEKGLGPLLKRPFSLFRIGPEEDILLLYQVVGAGTELLARVSPGEHLEVLGPLGRGFFPPADLARAYLVAGGMGLAPLQALAEALHLRTELTLFHGSFSSTSLLNAGHEVDYYRGRQWVTTEDGSAGEKGLVTAVLARELTKSPAPVFACGPRAMLAETVRLARAAAVPCQVSLEAHMACGLGACQGCVVELASSGGGPVYGRVCKEGPVFSAEEIKW
ncbi:MAG: dihydroorotate dehydrogenase electron transfer subunit [Thermodesulfobacteriota bacterium]